MFLIWLDVPFFSGTDKTHRLLWSAIYIKTEKPVFQTQQSQTTSYPNSSRWIPYVMFSGSCPHVKNIVVSTVESVFFLKAIISSIICSKLGERLEFALSRTNTVWFSILSYSVGWMQHAWMVVNSGGCFWELCCYSRTGVRRSYIKPERLWSAI